MHRIKIIAYVFLATFVISGCATVQLINSKLPEQNIEIDGLDNEWSGSYTFIEDEKVVIGAKNDDEYLYLVLKTMDRQIKQKVLSNGLTIWIDTEADEKKNFGIHYPIGMMDWNKSQLYDPADWGTPEEREKILKEKSKIMLKEMRIISPYGRSEFDLLMKNPFGVEIAFKDTTGIFIYEMKIPMVSPEESMYSYALPPPAQIKIGIETGEIDKEKMMSQRSGGGMPSGGMGGGKGGGMMGKGGGMGRGNQSPMKNMLEPVKFWISLSLADSNKSIQHSDDK